MLGLFCVPPNMVQILYGGNWHFGEFACKLVPAVQGKGKILFFMDLLYNRTIKKIYCFSGANILISAFTIMVIAIDRWRSVTNTNPHDSLNFCQAGGVVFGIWALSFAGKVGFFNYYKKFQHKK